MKRLILIRHAKSDWGDASTRDVDRTINQRGQRDAAEMGRRLAERALMPDLFTASTATRARLSSELICEAMGFPAGQIVWRDELYLAAPSTMLDIIRSTDDHINSLALLAHNPGISELAERLSRQHGIDMPTSGIVCLQSTISHWREAGTTWQLQDVDYPKRLQ